MTRKDYILIARALARARRNGAANGFDMFHKIVESISEELIEDNPNFNKDMFKIACLD